MRKTLSGGRPSGVIRMQAKTASITLQLPHNDISFVESDSDGEWSGCSRTRKDPSKFRKQKNPKSPTEQRPELVISEENRNGALSRWSEAALQGVTMVCNSKVPDIGTKLLWLSVFHSAASRQAVQFECTALLGPWVVRFCTVLCRVQSHSELPRPFPHVVDFLESCRIPAMISLAFQGMRWLFRQQPPPAVAPPVLLYPAFAEGNQLRDSIAQINVSMEVLLLAVEEVKPQTAAEYAQIFQPIVSAFKSTLDRQQLERCRRLTARFDSTDAELMRYLLASNLLEARNNEDIERLFIKTTTRLQETLFWIDDYVFVNERAIRQHWNGLVCWTKRLESGHPVLLVRLGLAINTCYAEKAEEYSRVIVSQVDRGVRKLLKNNGVDTLFTIVDCDGASSANFNRIYALLHSVPILLNRHYPGRLETMCIVNVPVVLRWFIQVIKKFLHPATRGKIMVYGPDLSSLPEEIQEIIEWEKDRDHLPSAEELAAGSANFPRFAG